MAEILIDIHVHTTASTCSIFKPEQLIESVRRMNLKHVVVTNHHEYVRDIDVLMRSLLPEGVRIFSGLEMTCEWGDFLIYGRELELFAHGRKLFPVEALPRDDLAVVWAHPYRFFPPEEVDRIKFMVADYIDAVEVVNGNCLLRNPHANDLAVDLARELGKPMVAGSDAHSPDMFFLAHTRFEGRVESCGDIVRAIKEGRVSAGRGQE